MDELEDILRGLVLHDENAIRSMFVADLDAPDALGIDAATCALVRLTALAALGAPVVSYQATVAQALAAGTSPEDILDVLRAVATTVGTARIVAAAPSLALALGYDLDAALEARDWRRSDDPNVDTGHARVPAPGELSGHHPSTPPGPRRR